MALARIDELAVIIGNSNSHAQPRHSHRAGFQGCKGRWRNKTPAHLSSATDINDRHTTVSNILKDPHIAFRIKGFAGFRKGLYLNFFGHGHDIIANHGRAIMVEANMRSDRRLPYNTIQFRDFFKKAGNANETFSRLTAVSVCAGMNSHLQRYYTRRITFAPVNAMERRKKPVVNSTSIH